MSYLYVLLVAFGMTGCAVAAPETKQAGTYASIEAHRADAAGAEPSGVDLLGGRNVAVELAPGTPQYIYVSFDQPFTGPYAVTFGTEDPRDIPVATERAEHGFQLQIWDLVEGASFFDLKEARDDSMVSFVVTGEE